MKIEKYLVLKDTAFLGSEYDTDCGICEGP